MLDTAQPSLPWPGLPLQMAPAKRARRRAGTGGGVSTDGRASVSAAATAATPSHNACDAGQLRAERYAYLGLVARWDLSGREALVLAGEPLEAEAEQRARRQGLIGVNMPLYLIHPGVERSRIFLRQPHPAFDGMAPLPLMLAKGRLGIVAVRRHLGVLAGS